MKKYYEYSYRIYFKDEFGGGYTTGIPWYEGKNQLKYLYNMKYSINKIEWKTCFIAEETGITNEHAIQMRQIFP